MNSKETNIFIVDDDPVFTNIISKKLKEKDYANIQTFTNGFECLSQLHQSPDIIILDHFLEYEIGMNILKEIKEYDSEINVIYVSSQDKVSVALKAMRYGAVVYLEKSVPDIDNLVEIVDQIKNQTYSFAS